jgi:S-DNA-T family DNA segregation ATPase FtsK/SpoIIIE
MDTLIATPDPDPENPPRKPTEQVAPPGTPPPDTAPSESPAAVSPVATVPAVPTSAPPLAPQGAAVEPAPEVLEGELVEEGGPARARGLAALHPQHVVALVWGVARSPQATQTKAVLAYRARHAPRDLVRLGWFFLRGNARWIAKGWRWATHADLRTDARAARLAGDCDARRAAQELIRSDAHARWTKLGHAARRLLAGGLLLAFLAGVLALVDAQLPREQMWPWLATLYTVLAALAVLGTWMLKTAPLGWVIAAVCEGRDRTPGVGFLVRPSREDADSWVDERMISQALAHLGIAPLDRFFKNGGELTYTVPARVDGEGTYAQIRLPMGVTAEMVAAKRPTLAANLGRASLETWPTKGDEDGILDLWVADKGRRGKGPGPWPLLGEGTVDVFEGVPIGRSQRGEVVYAPLVGCNYLAGGKPGQGKTNFSRVLALGAALDPTAELWVFVMGQSPDFAPLEPRLSRYRMGMDDQVAEATVQALQDLLAEMERRGTVLERQPGSPPKTSRKLADRPGLGLHWLGCWIDECHELFLHPRHGKQAAELAVRLIKRGRKYGISLILATQSPTKDSIPREVTRNISCGVAFCVGDHVANDGLLGSGKYRAGVRATDLRFNKDRGTAVTVGLTEATFELIDTFYVPFEDGIDHVTPVITRAMANIDHLRRTGPTPTPNPDDGDGSEPVDHLADITAVLDGQRRMLTRVVLTRLAELNPSEYEGWTFTDLKAALAEHGIEPVKSDGVMVVRADDLTQAITTRNHERGAGGDEETGS